jgi:hypothetical protein
MNQPKSHFFFCGANSSARPRSPHCSGFQITHIRHTHSVGLLWTIDQPVAEAISYTTYNQHNKRISMYSAGYETAIPATKWLQTYDLDSNATGIGRCINLLDMLRGSTFKNPTNALWPYSVSMCIVRFSEQTAIISLFRISLLVSVTEIECVY